MSVFYVRYRSIKSIKLLMCPRVIVTQILLYPVKDEHCTLPRASEVTSVRTDTPQVAVACEGRMAPWGALGNGKIVSLVYRRDKPFLDMLCTDRI